MHDRPFDVNEDVTVHLTLTGSQIARILECFEIAIANTDNNTPPDVYNIVDYLFQQLILAPARGTKKESRKYPTFATGI